MRAIFLVLLIILPSLSCAEDRPVFHLNPGDLDPKIGEQSAAMNNEAALIFGEFVKQNKEVFNAITMENLCGGNSSLVLSVYKRLGARYSEYFSKRDAERIVASGIDTENFFHAGTVGNAIIKGYLLGLTASSGGLSNNEQARAACKAIEPALQEYLRSGTFNAAQQ